MEDGGLIEVGHIRHIFNQQEFGGVLLLDVVLLHADFLQEYCDVVVRSADEIKQLRKCWQKVIFFPVGQCNAEYNVLPNMSVLQTTLLYIFVSLFHCLFKQLIRF